MPANPLRGFAVDRAQIHRIGHDLKLPQQSSEVGQAGDRQDQKRRDERKLDQRRRAGSRSCGQSLA